MKKKQRKHFKIRVKPAKDPRVENTNALERAAIEELAKHKIEQTSAFIEAQRGKYPQALTSEQKAGPHREPYTARLLAEIESGETSIPAIEKMKQTEDELMALGVWQYSSYYTSISEVLGIVKPQDGVGESQPQTRGDDADFEDWLSRNYLRALKMSIEAQDEWLKYLHEVVGVDTSWYPSEDTYVPELGITYRQVFCPNSLEERFHKWFEEEYFPKHVNQE